MSCKIEKSKNGKIVAVKDQSGNKSTLFQKLLNVPTLSLNEAIDAYKNIYSEQLKDKVQINYSKSIADNSIQQAIQRNNGNPLTLAPNGKPSILYQSYKDLGYSDSEAERLTAQVYSNEFINSFFGDWINDPQNASKVVDSEGMPLLVFHGTNAKFSEFQNKIGIRGNQFTGSREVKSDTFFFTDDLGYAEKASNIRRENFGGNKNIISSFLNIRKPLDFTTFDYETEEKFNEITGEYPSSYFGYNDNLDQWWRLFDKDEDDVTNIVKERGYNGVMLAEEVKTIKDDKGYDVGTASIKSFGVFNPNQIKSATENIGTFSTESNDIRYQIIGEKGAQNLDKIEEATFRMDNLKVAREMEAAGKTPKEIRLATGWEKNVADQKWRYEILDGSVKDVTLNYTNNNGLFENPTANIKLSELYSNQELFKAYPKLKNTEVVFYDTKNELYNDNLLFVVEDKIYINKKDYDRQKLGGNLKNIYNGSTLEQAIAHELSHIIQTNEGFAQGSSRQFNKDLIRGSISFFRSRANKLSERDGFEGRYDRYVERTLRNSVANEVADSILNTNNIPLDLVVNTMYDRLYKNFAGEVEARNVENRFFMSPQQRLEQTLQETQDIPFEDQFVLQYKNNMQSSQRIAPQITQEIIDKLKQNGLSEDVLLLSTEEIKLKIKQLKKDGLTDSMVEQVAAWHGSPYNFNKFTTNAMGTGEGAQAFGWGLYFTDLESVAREYAEKLANSKNEEIEDIYSKFFKDSLVLEPTDKFVDMLIKSYGYQDNSDLKKYRVENNNIKDVLNYLYENFGVYIKADQYISKDGFTVEQNIKKIKDDGFFTKDSISIFEKKVYDSVKYQKNLYKTTLHKGKKPSEYTWLDWYEKFNFTTELQEKLKNTLPLKLRDRITESYFTSNSEKNNINSLNSIIDADSIKILERYGIYEFMDFSDLEKQVVSTINDLSEDFEEGFDLSTTSNDTIRGILNKLENSSGKINFISKRINGEKAYRKISQILGSNKKASLFLLENGIDGIKYPAESISRGATSDTARGFNYVVFDENAITIEEQIQFSKSLNNVGINLITNGLTYKDSKTGKDIVILNKDTADDSTLLHEFSHIFSKWQKENRPELWKKGQDLAKNAIKSGEIKDIENYVKQTQPKLKEGSEAFYDEVLQEFIGRESKNMMDEQKNGSASKSPLMQWLSDFWDEIRKMLSLTSMTPEQVANLNLKEFARASVVDLLKGERIRGEEAQELLAKLITNTSFFNLLEDLKIMEKIC